MKRIWIIPVNDGEAVEIRNLLTDAGEKVTITRQAWGATWQNLEPAVVAEVEKTPGAEIIGVELGGPSRWGGRNVDHHRYSNEDRSNPQSSLEQVADLLGVKLSRFQTLVAENDKGWIPAMEKAGAHPDEIKIVRAQDRLSQGVMPDAEAQAVKDIASAEWQGKKVLIRCPKGATSAHTDRLYGQFGEALTVDEVSGKWIYFGPRHQGFYRLTEGGTKNARWVGGQPESGYSGVEKPTEKIQEELLEFFWKIVH